MVNHEMWRDEYHSWQIATSSKSFYELVINRKLEGHPILWYSILYSINKLGYGLILVKFINYAFAISAIFLFVRYSRFSLLIKALFIFSYLCFYEFPAFARNYAIGFFFLMLFNCLYFKKENFRYFIILILILIIGSLTNICIYFINIGLLFTLLFETHTKYFKRWKFSYLVILSLTILVFILIFADLFLPQILMRLERYGGAQAFLIQLQIRYFSFYYVIIFAFISIFIVFITLKYVKKIDKENIFLFSFTLTTLLISSFFLIIYPGSARHFGHIYVALISFFWISDGFFFNIFGRNHLNEKIIILILVLQLPITSFAIYSELKRPYSQIQNAAKYIKNSKFENRVIIGDPIFVVEGLAAQLGKGIFYSFDYPFGFKFVSWKFPNLNKGFKIDLVEKICKDQKIDAIILTKEKISNEIMLKYPDNIKFLKEFSGSISDENFYLYNFNRINN